METFYYIILIDIYINIINNKYIMVMYKSIHNRFGVLDI